MTGTVLGASLRLVVLDPPMSGAVATTVLKAVTRRGTVPVAVGCKEEAGPSRKGGSFDGPGNGVTSNETTTTGGATGASFFTTADIMDTESVSVQFLQECLVN